MMKQAKIWDRKAVSRNIGFKKIKTLTTSVVQSGSVWFSIMDDPKDMERITHFLRSGVTEKCRGFHRKIR